MTPIIIPDFPQKYVQVEQVLVPRGTTSKKISTAKPEKPDTGEHTDHTKCEDWFNKKQVAKCPGDCKEQLPFEYSVSSQQMRNKRIPVNHSEKKLKQKFLSV